MRSHPDCRATPIAARQDDRNALATGTVHAAGIRAHALLTLGRPDEQPPDDRRARSRLTGTAAEGMKFAGRGGLDRDVLLPHRLEERRLDVPERAVDLGVRYLQRYDVVVGHAFSMSFARASMEALGKSRGAHELRHSYAQERMRELMHHAEHALALAIVSEEMGHLRPDITWTYCVDHPPAFKSKPSAVPSP